MTPTHGTPKKARVVRLGIAGFVLGTAGFLIFRRYVLPTDMSPLVEQLLILGGLAVAMFPMVREMAGPGVGTLRVAINLAGGLLLGMAVFWFLGLALGPF